MRSLNGLLTPLLLIGWLVGDPASTAAQTSRPASHYGEPQPVCQIADRRLDEASGLVAGRRNPGYYYTHNDSQGRPQVYVFNRHGRICLTIRLVGAENRDWEDIALAPGEQPGTFDVCVADIGDNQVERSGIVLYRFLEPQLDAAVRARGVLQIRPQVFRCKYEDGARNAEAFAVDPRTGDGYVFTKRFDGASHVYRRHEPQAGCDAAVSACRGAGTHGDRRGHLARRDPAGDSELCRRVGVALAETGGRGGAHARLRADADGTGAGHRAAGRSPVFLRGRPGAAHDQ